MSQAERILVVDDEADFAKGLARLLNGRFPAVHADTAFSGPEALAKLAEAPAGVMFTDLRMPAMNGLALLEQALARAPGLSVVLLTAHGTIQTAVEALKAGAYDFLTKPLEPEDLFRVADKALERSRLLGENAELKALLAQAKPTLVGQSPVMERLRMDVAAVARNDYTVLVTGDSGTGKELVSRMVHDLSPRKARPFVSVNCPAIPDELLESELFGHVKGAFTGADRDHDGVFASANGGTLHLDEVGDISPSMQTKLLRCLQEGELRPVGASRNRKVDVRVVASTNRDLEAMVRKGTFRGDLYYRLNVLSIRVPPLAERTADIPLLAQTFLSKAAAETGSKARSIAPEVMTRLMARPWPGNVRELLNTMRRLAVFCQGRTVTLESLRLATGAMPCGQACNGQEGFKSYKHAKAEVLDEFTTAYVTRLLEATRGNVSEAARQSGLTRAALQKIMTRLDIFPAGFKQP